MTWQYIAGFFDGEGSVVQNKKGFRVIIPQTNLIVLRTIQRFVGNGLIIEVARRRAHWKESWVYYIAKQQDIQRFLKGIAPHLIVKHTKVRLALQRLRVIIHRQIARSQLTQFRKAQARLLRKRGLSYRAIGRKIGIDWGHARRLTLSRR